MLGTGLGHFIPIAVYLGFWAAIFLSFFKNPVYGLYYVMPFLPYRLLRDRIADYPLGGNMLTMLLVAVIISALFRGKRLPKSNLYPIWLVFAIYLYFSMWLGVLLSNAPAPLWLNDPNFYTFKDYMTIPLVFVAAGLTIEDRKTIKNVILITAVTLALIDRSCILESMSRTWGTFDEEKRGGGPLSYGSNQTAAFLAQFAMFFWGVLLFVRSKWAKVGTYVLVAATIFAVMYTFSRAGYISVLLGVLVLGVLKDRKLLLVLGVFLVTWQTIVPDAVRERVTMTKNANGQLEASAQERVDLWTNAEDSFLHSPIVGKGYATFQFGEHVADLKDTHNWYVKVMVETGIIGMVMAIFMLQQMLATSYRLFRKTTDPLYRGLGLGLVAGQFACMLANCFGDRWTYLEIMGLFWVLIAAAIRALKLSAAGTISEPGKEVPEAAKNRYLAYR